MIEKLCSIHDTERARPSNTCGAQAPFVLAVSVAMGCHLRLPHHATLSCQSTLSGLDCGTCFGSAFDALCAQQFQAGLAATQMETAVTTH